MLSSDLLEFMRNIGQVPDLCLCFMLSLAQVCKMEENENWEHSQNVVEREGYVGKGKPRPSSEPHF